MGTMTTKTRWAARATALAASVAIIGIGAGVAPSAANARNIPGRCTYTNSEPTVRQGSSGTAVKQVQCELNYSLRSVSLAEDGDFGAKTAAAVRKFQGCANLSVDGVVGPKTWGALDSWASSSTYVC